MTERASLHRLIFDITNHTHLPTYLRYLIEYRKAHELPGTLSFVVARPFLEQHADIVALAEHAPHHSIRFVPLMDQEQEKKIALELASEYNAPSFAELVRADQVTYPAAYGWELFCKYALQLGATHGFIIHLDAYLPLFATPLRLPVPLSGIYFGPTFHYPSFHDVYTDAQLQPQRMMREKFVLARALREPRFERLFMLDPFAVGPAQKMTGGDKVAFLHDPLDSTSATDAQLHALETDLGIGPGRKTFLYFGEITARKGVNELLNALDTLSADTASKICLLIAGHCTAARQADIESRSAQLRARLPIQIVERYGYIPHADVAAYFQRSDIVLAPYPRHDGMSGISLLAAAFEKPVLSSTYGVMGEMTRRYCLGLAVNVTNPAQFAEALAKFVNEDAATFCDITQMRRIAVEHRAAHFAQAILESH